MKGKTMIDAISMNGDAKVKGQKADVDVSFSDIWDELNFAFMLEYEARKGRWGLWGNTIYANLGKSDADKFDFWFNIVTP